MTLSNIADLADLLTAVGVIVSLLFVLYELRKTNRESQLANWFTFTNRRYEHLGQTKNPHMADIVHRGRQEFEHLTDVEQLAYVRYLIQSQIVAQGFRRLAGYGSDSEPVAKKAALRNIREEFDHPGPRAWWASVRDNPPMVAQGAGLIDEALGYSSESIGKL